jgi:putrescine transport system ATP-binding protein
MPRSGGTPHRRRISDGRAAAMMVTQSKPLADTPWLDPRATAQILIDGVSKAYDTSKAVDDVTLQIYRGEMFALVGASGCGKTTLLRMLAGFTHPSSGRICIDGVDMSSVPPHERPVNMMFQSYALFPHMTVEDNVGYGLRRLPLDKHAKRTRIEEALEMVQLGGLAQRKPHQLSGGQRQRVALARALIRRPKVLLLDEPLSALDKKLREQTQFELMDLQHQVGITFIVVTHDQDEAMALATRIAVMNRGQVVQVGTPAQIYEFPCSRFVADFVGTTNLFEGTVSSWSMTREPSASVSASGSRCAPRRRASASSR